MDGQKPTDNAPPRPTLRGRGREILLGEQSRPEPKPAPPVAAPAPRPEAPVRRERVDPTSLPLTPEERAALLDFSPASPAYRLDVTFPEPGARRVTAPLEAPEAEPAPATVEIRRETVILGQARPAPATPRGDAEKPPSEWMRAPRAEVGEIELLSADGWPLGERSPDAAALGMSPGYNPHPAVEELVPVAERWMEPDRAGPPLNGGPAGRPSEAHPISNERTDAEPEASYARNTVTAVIQQPPRALFDRAASSDLDLLDLLVDDDRIRKLSRQIEALQEDLAGQADGGRASADLYLDDLLRASNLLRSSRANYDEARAIVVRVRADMNRQRKVEADIRRYRPRLVGYFLLWVMALAGLFVLKPAAADMAERLDIPAASALYFPVLFGMAGALVAGFLHLDRHTTKLRDFDPIYVSSYLVGPLLGGVMGLLMFVVATLANQDLLHEQAETAEYAITYLLCVLAGMNQHHILRRLDDLLKRFGRGG